MTIDDGPFEEENSIDQHRTMEWQQWFSLDERAVFVHFMRMPFWIVILQLVVVVVVVKRNTSRVLKALNDKGLRW